MNDASYQTNFINSPENLFQSQSTRKPPLIQLIVSHMFAYRQIINYQQQNNDTFQFFE